MNKIIFLIIDSDYPHFENYAHCREIWRKYMNLSENIKCFFIKFKNDINQEYIIDEKNNYIYCKGEESYIPGILNKTITSMKAVLENYEFDFLIRTNLSSFWNFKVLNEHIETLPKTLCVNAVIGNHNGINFPSGSGFIMSRDTVEILSKNQNFSTEFLDDVIIGLFLNSKNIEISQSNRFNFTEFHNENQINELINQNINNHYHYRVLYDRSLQDKNIRNTLLNKIYHPFLTFSTI